MPVRRCISVPLLLLLLVCRPSVAVVIEGTEFPLYTAVDDEFADQGARFSSNLPYVTFARNAGGDGQGVLGVFGTDAGGSGPSFGRLLFSAPIVVTFVDPADGTTPAVVNGTVSAVWGDGGGDTDYIRLRAFDKTDNLIGTIYSSATSWGTVEFAGNGIHKVIFDQQPAVSATSDTFLDRLSFPTPVLSGTPGDLDDDADADLNDFALLADQWGTSGAAGRDGDINNDGNVDWRDLNLFTRYWLEGTAADH